MKLTKSPRLIFDPRPSPGPHPNPAAKPVWNPTHHDARGIPDGAIVSDVVPRAIFIQIVDSMHTATNIACGLVRRNLRVSCLIPVFVVVAVWPLKCHEV